MLAWIDGVTEAYRHITEWLKQDCIVATGRHIL